MCDFTDVILPSIRVSVKGKTVVAIFHMMRIVEGLELSIPDTEMCNSIQLYSPILTHTVTVA